MMRGRKVLLLLAACVALGAIAHAAPPSSQSEDSPGAIKGLLAALDDPSDEVVALALIRLDKSIPAHPEVRERLEAFIEEPRLKQALKAGKGELWSAAVLTRGALGKATEDELPHLIKLLNDSNPDVHAVAVRALGDMGAAAREQAPRLVELLKDADRDARAAVAMALEPGEALALLKHPDPSVREAAAGALGNMGEAAQEHIPLLVALLKDPSVREDAVAALENMGAAAREHAPRLAGLLKDLDPEVRRAAAGVLGSMGEAAREYAPRLAELLKDKDSGVRQAAAGALGNMGEAAREYAPRLIALLKDPEVREAAAGALGNMGEAAREHTSRLAELLKDPDPDVRTAVAGVLGDLRGAAREQAPHLAEALKDGSPEVRRAAAMALGNMGEAAREQAPHLVEALKDPAVRSVAATALGNMGKALALLKHPDPEVRRVAVRSLGNTGEGAREQAPRLIALLEDSAPSVRKAVVEALGNMGEAAREHTPRLIALLEDPDPEVRRAVMEALGNMGEAAREYTPRLIELLEDDDPYVVKTARGLLLAWAPLELQHVAAFVVVAEQDPSQVPEGLLWAHMAGGGDPQIELALRWLGGRDFSALPKELRLEEARATLRAFTALWPATEKYPGLRDELARQVTQVVYLQHRRWTKADRALLGALQDDLRPSHPKQADELDKTLGAMGRGQWLKKLGWGWVGHVGFWLLLIFFYPRSAQVQALFFWNPWVRKILGFGYVGLLLTWVPFVRRRLLSPFHELLLADADLEHFQVKAYFDRSEVRVASTGQRELLLRALPSLRGQVVLEGASGLGKSMFIKYLLRSSNHLAVYLTAERCKEGVLEAIQAKLEGHARDTTFLRSIIYSGALDIYIDGLNEVAADTRARIVQFVELNFHGDILLATQRMEWTPPATARLYELQPLTEEQISQFLLSREPLLEGRSQVSGEAYRESCAHFLTLALSSGQPEEIRQAMREVLSNPMDLTVVARMLAEGLSPALFQLRQQQYALMARDYQEVNLAEFPLEAFSEEAYRMRLEVRATLPEETFGKELLRMESFKMVVRRQWRSPDGTERREWHFRHDKIQDYFIAQTFLGQSNPRIVQHRDDPRFRGVYFLLAKLLAPEEAKALQDELVEHAAETRDHTVSDEFVNLLKARRRVEQVRTQAVGA
jgi:HEAT repeat protein